MEAVYGRSLYQKIKKDGKQPYFKLKHQSVQQAKQAKQIEQIPVRDIESVRINYSGITFDVILFLEIFTTCYYSSSSCDTTASSTCL